jgi:hypothetical protein
VVVKMWVGLMTVGVELLLLGWMIAGRGVDWLTAGLTLGR